MYLESTLYALADSDANMMLHTRSLFRNWSWKIPPEVRMFNNCIFHSISLSFHTPSTPCYLSPKTLQNVVGGSPGPPLNVGNSLSMVYWLLRVIPLGIKVYPLYTRWKSSHLRGVPVGRPAGRSVLQSGDNTNNTSSAELRPADLFVITIYSGSVNKVSFAYKI